MRAIRRALPGARVRIACKDILEITWLSPHTSILADAKDGERQDCILASFLLAWPADETHKNVTLWSAWSVEFPDHACARYLQQRLRPAYATVDELGDALFAAGTEFMASDFAAVNEHLRQGSTLYLAAGDGCFVGEMIRGKSKTRLYTYARARTYLTADMMGVDQSPLAAAANPEQSTLLTLWRTRDVPPTPTLSEPARCDVLQSSCIGPPVPAHPASGKLPTAGAAFLLPAGQRLDATFGSHTSALQPQDRSAHAALGRLHPATALGAASYRNLFSRSVRS